MLGQEDLFEAAPARRIIVPAGRAAWWGVDGSTLRVAIATVEPHAEGPRRGVSVATFPTKPGLMRLPDIRARTAELAFELAGHTPPGLVFVEQPSGSGQQVNHELEFAVGAIAAGIGEGIVAALGSSSAMELVVGAHWKLVACGSGGIRKTKRVEGRKKPVRKEVMEYEVLQWARAQGYPGIDWDEADAMGIAECARRDVELVQR